MFLYDGGCGGDILFKLALKITGAIDGEEVGNLVIGHTVLHVHLSLAFGRVYNAFIDTVVIDKTEDND